jgi:hypothetical protein
LSYLKRLVFLTLILQTPVLASQNLDVSIGGGYSGNLFADSFSIGNSYLANGLSFSSINFNKIKFKLYYDFYYYQYDTGDLINSTIHLPGITVYRRSQGEKLKWGVDMFAAVKDYIDARALFDNARYFASGDISYYFSPGFQFKLLYRAGKSDYKNYGSLNYLEHLAESEAIATFPTKTTFRGLLRYCQRNFDLETSYYWFDEEFGISQSLGSRTGLSIRLLNRWSGNGIRPIPSYRIISGISSYWDPWRGIQLESGLRRILPWEIVGNLNAGYWQRIFTYDDELRFRFPWLRLHPGRTDRGWISKLELNRQFKLGLPLPRLFNFTIAFGYIDNRSDDPYYKYHYFFAGTNLKIKIF